MGSPSPPPMGSPSPPFVQQQMQMQMQHMHMQHMAAMQQQAQAQSPQPQQQWPQQAATPSTPAPPSRPEGSTDAEVTVALLPAFDRITSPLDAMHRIKTHPRCCVLFCTGGRGDWFGGADTASDIGRGTAEGFGVA